MKVKYFIFDLDDTLVYEIEYLKSAYKEIATSLGNENIFYQMLEWYQNGIDVFQKLSTLYSVSKEGLLEQYRSHFPSISLTQEANIVLNQIKREGHYLGLISDGRSLTQRNKLKALGIEHFFDKIVISEEVGATKPNLQNFKVFENDNVSSYFYIGDNVNKDFITPNQLGWQSVCLIDKGQNIHKQNFDISKSYIPRIKIKCLKEILAFI